MARREATAEQKLAAAERRERFRALAKQVAELPEEARTALVDRCGAVVTCEGRALSFVNTCLVLTQRPSASMVGGFAQWLKIDLGGGATYENAPGTHPDAHWGVGYYPLASPRKTAPGDELAVEGWHGEDAIAIWAQA